MREIKFRGKRVDANVWVYGYFFVTNKSNPIHEETYWILTEEKKYKVIPESVGQHTGLKDNTEWKDLTEKERKQWTLSGNMPSEWKGKEIYEGDIVYVAGHGLHIVKFPFFDLYEVVYYGHSRDIEDIRGNIYENQKLVNNL